MTPAANANPAQNPVTQPHRIQEPQATPGTDRYTLELRYMWTQMQREAGSPSNWQQAVSTIKQQQRWEELETRHLRSYPVLARRRHLQMLHPQVMVGGLDVSAYPVGLLSICGLGVLGTGGMPNIELALLMSVLGGTGVMFLFDRAMTRSYRRAAQSFGIEHKAGRK